MRQVLMVQRCQEPLSDVDGQEVMRGKDYVVSRAAGLQFREKLFVAWKGIVGNLHPKFLFKLGDGIGMNVVFPVIDEQLFALFFDPVQHLRRWVWLGSHLSDIRPHDIRQQ